MNFIVLLGVMSTLLMPGLDGTIGEVVVTSDRVVVTGVSRTGATLRELRPHEFSGNGAEVSDVIEPGRFRLELPRRTNTYDRIDSRWTLGDVGSTTWATDISNACVNHALQPMVARNRKGLGGIHPDPRLFQDLVDLGVGHITVNILLGHTDGRQLDRLLTFAHKNRIIVTAILLVPPRGSVLSHPDCDPTAHYAMPNMTSEAGVAAFRKKIAQLAQRYCQPGFPHGRISHWILGNEVDAGWVWTNAGEKTSDEYMEQYHHAMRVAYYAVRRFDPNGKVYISLTHHWNTRHRPNPKRFYKPMTLLNMLAARSRGGGDFEWGVAYHPYANNLFDSRTWDDRVTNDFDTPQITMKNIAVLDRYLRQRRFLYRGKTVRTVLLSEQGYHTKGLDPSPEAEALQARAIAYAWKQMKGLGSIQAFHYHRWIDHEREGGLRLGLWTVKPGSTTWPDRKKASWALYRDLATGREDAALNQALLESP